MMSSYGLKTSLLLSAVLLSGCGLFRKVSPPVHTVHFEDDKAERREIERFYREGVALLEKREFTAAVESLGRFHRRYPTTQYSQEAEFHLAQAYEGVGDCGSAVGHYRAVVSHRSSGEALRARASYRLSFCHEALNEDVKALAALQDAMIRKEHLPREVALAEAPARMATVYARLGNERLAHENFARAEEGIRRLRRAPSGPENFSWLPKTLFFMGYMAAGGKDSERSLNSLKQAQKYLLQAAESGDAEWSVRAADQLIEVYSGLWSNLEKGAVAAEADMNTEDREMIRHRRREQRRNVALEMQEAIQGLESARLPGKENEAVARIFVFLHDLYGRLTLFLQKTAVQDGLTPEARGRQGLKREGRIRDDGSVPKTEDPNL